MINIPWSAYLCRNGLKGKIRLLSSMSEEDIISEIHSVFKRPFQDQEFSFATWRWKVQELSCSFFIVFICVDG